MQPSAVRTRMAPSPTGWLHVGTARTALFNYLFSRHTGGAFVLRIEDTDTERSRPEYEKDIIDGLRWLGIEWDEGPGADSREYKGDFGPYRQSERTGIYKKYLQKLLKQNSVFFCEHSKEELEQEHMEQRSHNEPVRHVCTHRTEGREQGIVRFKNTDTGVVSFPDLIHGDISFDGLLLGDFSIAKNIETPLYNFSAVVDDYEMRITHIIRGEDHISNTPKQLLLGQALGFPRMTYAHIPLILGSDRSKLSKRSGEISLSVYRDSGYTPEALLNFLALLGWNPGTHQELFSLEELQKEFSLERVQRAGAVFNKEKLRWLNHEYIKRMTEKELAERLLPYISKDDGFGFSADTIIRIAAVERERLEVLSDIQENLSLYKNIQPEYGPDMLCPKGSEDMKNTLRHLEEVRNLLCDIDDISFMPAMLKERLMPYAVEQGKGNVLWPLRVALSGRERSPGPFEIMYIIGKQQSINRIEYALRLCQT